MVSKGSTKLHFLVAHVKESRGLVRRQKSRHEDSCFDEGQVVKKGAWCHLLLFSLFYYCLWQGTVETFNQKVSLLGISEDGPDIRDVN